MNTSRIALLMMATVLASCMPPRGFAYDDAERSMNPLAVIWATPLSTLNPWSFQPEERATPKAAHSTLLVTGGRDGKVRGVFSQSGRIAWETEVDEPVASQPIVIGKSVALGDMGGILRKLDLETGKEDWQYKVDSSIVTAPTYGDGRLFAVSNRNTVFAVDAVTGKYLWHKSKPHKTSMTVDGQARVRFFNGKLIVGYSDGTLRCMEPEDGATVWTVELGGGAPRFGDVDTYPLVVDGRVIASSFLGGMAAVQLEDGKAAWKVPVEGMSEPILYHGHLIATTATGEIVAIRVTSGEVVWRTSVSEPGRRLTAPTRVGYYGVFADGKGLVVFQLSTGRIEGRWSVGDGFSARPEADDESVYAVSNGGVLYRLGPQQ